MRYVKIYHKLLQLNFSGLTAYRSNFINSIISSIAWGFFSLYSIVILTSHTAYAYGWRREEILLFNGMYGIIVGIYHMFLSINMRRISHVLRWGELDLILAKPLDTQIALSFWWIDFSMVFRVLMSVGYSLWFIFLLKLTISPLQIVLTIVLALFAIILLYSIWFIALTSLIWFPNLSNLVILLFSFESLARYPKEVAQQLISYIFLILLPLTLVINTPTRLLLNHVTIPEIIELFVLSMGLLYVSRVFWKFALKYYTSASS
ncbi:ABC-2 family transporter protein [Candidatus Gottesmanbacteria bacterium]|nr:ABC-2 family transporter protein [Candidatus Gottesmanbacteria bacterium]